MTRRIRNFSHRAALTAIASIALPLTAMAVPASEIPAGWRLNWADEFDGTTLDTARWENTTRRDSFNNEKQYYTASQVAVANGNVRITANNVPLDGKAFRSGLIRTWGEQTYGRWETRASLPAGKGMWPAIWLLPRNANWPTGGEIDIMENRGSAPTVIGSAYHFGNSVATHQYIDQDFSYAVNGTPVSFHGSMHTYAVEWDQARIRYLIDGVPSFTFYRNRAPISSTPMSLIINLAVGGDFGGDPDASTKFPQHLDVDYVRVFDRDHSTAALENGSFETMAGNLFTSWNEYSNGGGNVVVDSVAANARTGTKALQVYGRFNGTASNTSGVYQELATSPGEVWQLDAWARNRPGDVLAGTNQARIRIEFIDANGAIIEGAGLSVADASTPTVYRESLVRRTAPPNARFARAVLEVLQNNNAVGAANFDDVSLRRVPGTGAAGDLNLDGVANAADVDALQHSLAAINAAFNFNGDSAVNAADVDAFLASAFNTVRGDTDLNGAVDFADLLTLAQNYGRTRSATWALGDFSGEGDVMFDDLLTLAQRYGTGAASVEVGALGLSETFAADWALAVSLVPEPSVLCAAAGWVLVRRTRDRAAASRATRG